MIKRAQVDDSIKWVPAGHALDKKRYELQNIISSGEKQSHLRLWICNLL